MKKRKKREGGNGGRGGGNDGMGKSKGKREGDYEEIARRKTT